MSITAEALIPIFESLSDSEKVRFMDMVPKPAKKRRKKKKSSVEVEAEMIVNKYLIRNLKR